MVPLQQLGGVLGTLSLHRLESPEYHNLARSWLSGVTGAHRLGSLNHPINSIAEGPPPGTAGEGSPEVAGASMRGVTEGG